MVDQTPLSKTPRSSPVVYLGVFDAVRELFATCDEARAAGLSAGSFSFNSGDGRCERCGGIGFEKIEMQFLSDLYVRCSECEGKRFQPHILKVHYHGKNIHDVLELTVSESIPFLESRHGLKGVPNALRVPLAALRILEEVGLGLPASGSAAQHAFRRRGATSQARRPSGRARTQPRQQRRAAHLRRTYHRVALR